MKGIYIGITEVIVMVWFCMAIYMVMVISSVILGG